MFVVYFASLLAGYHACCGMATFSVACSLCLTPHKNMCRSWSRKSILSWPISSMAPIFYLSLLCSWGVQSGCACPSTVISWRTSVRNFIIVQSWYRIHQLGYDSCPRLSILIANFSLIPACIYVGCKEGNCISTHYRLGQPQDASCRTWAIK